MQAIAQPPPLLSGLRFDNAFVRDLPADPVGGPHRRQVHGALYSRVDPTPVKAPKLVAWSREMAERLGITPFAGTPVRRLSGGQRQRVALAAALIGRPEVAFLDEPSAGLDPHARLDVWDLVRTTADAGCAVVLTTHSFEEAERLADRVVIVASGRTVAEGTPAEVAAGSTLEERYFALTHRAVA